MPGDEVLRASPRPAAIRDQKACDLTVVVIDDRRCFAELLALTLRSVPGIRCVGTASSVWEGINRVKDLAPAVVLLNLELSAISGLAVTRRLRAVSPGTAVALMSEPDDGVDEARAAQAGASILIPRSGSLAELIGALQAFDPLRSVDSSAAMPRPRRQRCSTAACGLTFRELEVLGYIEEGLPTKRIAKVMGIRAQTCYGYINTLYRKLGVRSRIAAVNRARQLQLL